MNPNNFISFWRPTDPYSWLGQWYYTDFVLTAEIVDRFPVSIKTLDLYKNKFEVIRDLVRQRYFNCAEKFMMMGKAALFEDEECFIKMSRQYSPRTLKSLGQQVKNFNEDTWMRYCRDIVKIGNYLKFTQDNELKAKLIDTGDAVLVEGSPVDKLWGVGLRFDDPRINNRTAWKGNNYLGESLMFVRNIIK